MINVSCSSRFISITVCIFIRSQNKTKETRTNRDCFSFSHLLDIWKEFWSLVIKWKCLHKDWYGWSVFIKVIKTKENENEGETISLRYSSAPTPCRPWLPLRWWLNKPEFATPGPAICKTIFVFQRYVSNEHSEHLHHHQRKLKGGWNWLFHKNKVPVYMYVDHRKILSMHHLISFRRQRNNASKLQLSLLGFAGLVGENWLHAFVNVPYLIVPNTVSPFF